MLKRIPATLALGLGLLFLLCLPAASHAQAVFGSIFGTVTDNTGAAIPGATVTVTDVAKGTSVVKESGASGEYSIEHLIPDSYDIKVTFQGFQTSETKGIQVFADTSAKVDVKMTIGGESQTVEVNADAVPVLKTDRADVSTVFDSKTITDLPIGDRNFTNLQLLLPGAQPLNWGHAASENPQGSRQIQIDGQAFGGVAFELDGTDNQDPILGIIVINPPMDAISETKITTQNFDAEFGKAVSSIVTAQTKSGTNSFHGSAFDYRQSSANLARDPYSQFSPDVVTGKLIPDALKNQFGGSVGGPVLKNKLFFFGDYQGLRQKVGTSNTVTVPSALLVSTCLGQAVGPSGIPGCDFSEYAQRVTPTGAGTVYQQVVQPNGTTTSVPYPSNVIPANLISSQAKGLLTLLQPYAPNSAGSYGGLKNNYSAGGTGLLNSNAWDERVDFTVSERVHVFERFSRFTDLLSGSVIFGAAGGAGFGIGGYGGNSKGANDSVAAGADIALSNSLVTDVRAGYYRYNIVTSKYNQGVDFATQLGIPGMNIAGQPLTSGAPGFNLTEVGSTGGPTNAQDQGPQYGAGLNVNRCNCPLEEREDQFQLANNWTKIIKTHSIKFGADLRYARNLRVPSDSDRTGLINFATGPTSDPAVTGNAPQGGLGFATFVLGQSTEFKRFVSTSTNAKEFQKRDFFYAQDTWRMTPNLTVNLGLRYEMYFPESVNGKGNGALMDLKTGYLQVAGYGNIKSNMNWSKPSYPFNPRIGVAYQMDPKTVVRAGYGRSFDIGVFGSIFGHVVTQNLPVLAAQDISTTSGPAGYAFCLGADNAAGCAQPAGQPAGGGPVAATPVAVPANGLLPAPGYAVSPRARPDGLRLPTIDAWNLSIQRAITPTLSLTAAYVGNKGTHTLSAGDGNNTNPNEAAIVLPAQYSITGQPLHYDPSVSKTVGIAADGGTANQTFLQRYYGGSLPACRDANYAPQAGVPAGSCGWSNGIGYYGDDQDSHFNSLQITLAKQFTRGLSFNGSYAWQRGIDFNNNYATWDRSVVKGRNNDIREQQLIAYGLYQLPFGKNQTFLSGVPRWADEIIGGWQLSPVVNWSSGLPFTLTYGNCGSRVPGSVPCYVNSSGGSLPIKIGSFDPVNHRRTLFRGSTQSLTAASYLGFSAPGLDQIGNGGRNAERGPHFFNTDLSIQKNFPIRESLSAQFRLDAFNAFNHINAQFGGGGATQNIDGGDAATGDVYITNSTANFGQGPRQLQLSVRLQF